MADTAGASRLVNVDEGLRNRARSGREVVANAGAPGLQNLLMLLMLLLLLLLLGEQLSLVLSGLLGLDLLLDAHDFQLHHLHLQRIIVLALVLGGLL